MHLGEAFDRVGEHHEPGQEADKIGNGLMSYKDHNNKNTQANRADDLDDRID